MTDARTAVEKADYVLLTTFRKDGSPVGTPVWAASDDGKVFVWTETESWKVKRVRRNPAVTLQPCSYKGTPRGEVIDGTARVLDAAETENVRRLLRKKYFLIGPLVILGSTLRRGKSGTIGIEITPAQ
ncbi:PPOX class F420-dependent oxidoreductase [Nocardia cyriacigeorgica]|uniref:PPOX class F420-dependent oxidoreductase n=1 Tax=Nocardia cyriacigeorgica TaxID=135487 RepID=A0A6P1DH62_9NOCA|nr:PPOX class F420-dependent oxidoreductase [Nocardia cyriacigeorgica]NEW37367.1 PPOX class F420-dependent oxidoreductase [Nocardia cyriacigeorgica]NEW47913.1 PPOX class F420-dependent oxidoreductase [Nocardia cyriacigeorgica]NEW50567.1 PPOX class F420-dependent oxidoreductase [Nocardia cyriacigeorgica]NEW57718.1 PPOX class F420-dependent oxidoreductase [Nocardia cyriacigeorgica]